MAGATDLVNQANEEPVEWSWTLLLDIQRLSTPLVKFLPTDAICP